MFTLSQHGITDLKLLPHVFDSMQQCCEVHVDSLARTAGKNVQTATKLQRTRAAAHRPKEPTAGNTDAALEMKEMKVVHDVVNIALDACAYTHQWNRSMMHTQRFRAFVCGDWNALGQRNIHESVRHCRCALRGC
eukprot:m.1250817 g.1250817  ORF g.1250817 m.1250817 type:complete len:135 (-) comp24702_c0_seq70:58-462(-)